MDQIRITRTVPAQLEALGIAPAEVLRRAHLPETLLEQERVLVTTAQWFALWHAFEAINTDPEIGLKVANFKGSWPYDPLWITALSAPTFHTALTKIARYKRLFSTENIYIEHHGDVWHVGVSWYTTRQPTPPLLTDLTFACFVNLGERGAGWKLTPERVLFRRPEQHRAMYEAFFGCPIQFDADADMVVYRHERMMQPFMTRNLDLLAMLEPQLEAELRSHLAPRRTSEHVMALLRNRIAGQAPTAHAIAHELTMSTRTLQRRLADEGTHFQALLDTVRHELAKHYLRASSLELSEIAFLLGYNEASSFHRAFHQWEGLPPGQWRTATSASTVSHTTPG